MKLHPGISTAALADLRYLHKDKELIVECAPNEMVPLGLDWSGVHLVTITKFSSAGSGATGNYINLYNTPTGEGAIGFSESEIVLYKTTPEMIQAHREGAN